MAGPYYPTDDAGRDRLADELTARGLAPTQPRKDFEVEKIERMASAMAAGTFDWLKASYKPVCVGPGGEVMGGHHRVVAAHLVGVDLDAVPGASPQVRREPVNYRPVYEWIDELP